MDHSPGLNAVARTSWFEVDEAKLLPFFWCVTSGGSIYTWVAIFTAGVWKHCSQQQRRYFKMEQFYNFYKWSITAVQASITVSLLTPRADSLNGVSVFLSIYL